MKKLSLTLFAIALLAMLSVPAAAGDNARLQVIHNAADPAAEVVDVYVGDDLLIDDFEFRTATAFQSVPAGVELLIGVAPGNSTGAGDAIATFPVTLEARKKYVVVANGVLGGGFAPNPEGADIGFTLFATDNARESARWGWFVDLIGFHGATDAPEVDIKVRGAEWYELFDNLSYGEFSPYRSVLPKKYILDVYAGDGADAAVVASFDADLSGLRGGAAVAFASGFLAPDDNNGGPAFGLFAALPNGTVVELPARESTAKLQVIHNAADPAAEVVDIYVGDDLFIDDFTFRTASEFVTVPANTELLVGVAPGNSTGSGDAIATFPVTLAPGKKYVVAANGVLGGGFAPNPDGKDIGFTLYVTDEGRTSARWHRFVTLNAFHGSTDAPEVDIKVRNLEWLRLFNDLSYGEFSGYKGVPAKDYILDVYVDGDVVASFEAPLSGLGGGAAVAFASGFLSPDANNGGPGFGLFAALPDGTVIELPAVTPTAKLQVIHNSADVAADVVDIYVNGDLFLDNFEFRTATEFVDVPAGVELNIAVALSTSTSVADALATFPVTLMADRSYVVVASGVVTEGYDNSVNPNIGFNLFPTDDVSTSKYGHKRDVMLNVFHGSTDAPMVNVAAKRAWGRDDFGLLVDGLSYGEFSGSFRVPARKYELAITTGNDGIGDIVATFEADLRGLRGGSAVVFASGFLNPANNNDGATFGLFAALPNGAVVELPALGGALATGAAKGADNSLPTTFALNQNYPNPFNPTTQISFALPEASDVRIDVYNVLGQQVRTLVNSRLAAGMHEVTWDGRSEGGSSVSSGVYFYRLAAGDFSETRKMLMVK